MLLSSQQYLISLGVAALAVGALACVVRKGSSAVETTNTVPAGWHPASGTVPLAVTQKAISMLSQPYKYGEFFEYNGIRYLMFVEPHYDERRGWHKGVTAYVA